MELKYTEDPEGLHIDLEDLVAHLEQEANDRAHTIRQGLFPDDKQMQFFRGEIYGYRRLADQFKKLLGE